MRCDDVTRELAAPSDGRDDRALADHLANCPKCADWANRAASLDRLWQTTRPVDPSPDAWGSVWASVNAALDAAPAPQTARRTLGARGFDRVDGPSASGNGRFWRGLATVATITLAQAAAVLLAFVFAWHRPADPAGGSSLKSQTGLAQATVPSLDSVVDVEDGQVLYISSDGSKIAVRDVAAPEMPNGEDPWYVFFGRIESAGTEIAMTE
jgi:hypothetical protein